MRVVDLQSRNGTYFEGRRKRSFYLEPGQAFTVGARSHRVLALDDEMYAHYPALTAILGYEDEHAASSEAPSPSDLPYSIDNLRLCGCSLEQLVQKDLNDCPHCGRRLPAVER